MKHTLAFGTAPGAPSPPSSPPTPCPCPCPCPCAPPAPATAIARAVGPVGPPPTSGASGPLPPLTNVGRLNNVVVVAVADDGPLDIPDAIPSPGPVVRAWTWPGAGTREA